MASSSSMIRGLFDESSARSLSSSLWKSSVIDSTSSSLQSRMEGILHQDDAIKAGCNSLDVVTSSIHLDVNAGDDIMQEIERWRYVPDITAYPQQKPSTYDTNEGFALGHTLLRFLQQDNKENAPSIPSTVPFSNTVAVKTTQTDALPITMQQPMDLDQSTVVIPPKRTGPFMTAKDKLAVEDPTRAAALKRESQQRAMVGAASSKPAKPQISAGSNATEKGDDNPLPPELAHLEKALVEKIESEIVAHGQSITFDEIAGLEFAKKTVNELICWPMSRPDLFHGLRALPRGLLLFGPPGTGKTLIGKAIAHQVGGTFFSISASSLTSKWIGEGEKTVRTLFAVASYRQPSVVFIDEVDSLLCQRSADENEASRRIKTEFLVQLDGASTDQQAQVVIVGATNRPEELDDAARRRFVKRIYIPLPDVAGRKQLLITLLASSNNHLTNTDLEELIDKTEGFSGADIRSLCTEAALGPVREVSVRYQGNLTQVRECDVQPITMAHFEEALQGVASSVSQADLQRYIDWNTTYGSYRRME